ncbi:hypothetical protein BGZ61DRAFT_444576 [Ilyonectria robusta]|uniref:uncharacterized protein n=1 Tax=Ilyonectria robusta TaxID=1079257 RepID=UPI001E8E09FF|nr:uncharacterized protein BGZ61DRAFT_444576 [Ilyonectria robusta]KAH8733443.1 hypothetical protein BGZ61DRAFT_444576 [Ilyonectria robusta]
MPPPPCSISSSHNPPIPQSYSMHPVDPRCSAAPETPSTIPTCHYPTLKLVSPHTCHCHEPSSIPACSISPRSHSLCLRV